MAKIYTPRNYHFKLRNFGLDVPRCNWWAGPGSGKTGSSLWLFDTLRWYGEVERLLVVSTKRIASMVWSNEVAKWEDFERYKVAPAVGSPAERLAALRANADITTINYENLPWLAETVGDHWPWDMVIADESTKLKSLRIDLRPKKDGSMSKRKSGGSSRAYALAKVSHNKVRRWINLTGTPAPNGLIDNWGQMWYIDGGARLGRSFSGFKERWFNAVKPADDPHSIIYKPTPWADREIKELMRDVTLTIDARDYMELPDVVFNKIKVPLPRQSRDLYKQMEKEFFIELLGHEIEAFNAGSKSMKLRQLSSGAVYAKPDPGNDTAPWLPVHDEKLDALSDLVSELNGEPLLIAYQFRSDLARLKERFPKGRFFDDKPQTLADFRAGKIPQLFLHPASAGHGIDGMQDVCNHIAFFSQTWNLEEFEQVIERIGSVRQVSAGYFRNTFVHLLIGENTIEEEMVERTETKASVQDSLKLAMKRRG